MIKNKLKKQNGIALPIALFVLIGILLASASLIKATDSSMMVSGNVGSRAFVSNANDNIIMAANQWLLDNQTTLDNDNSSAGYFSAYPTGNPDYSLDANWTNSFSMANDAYGNKNNYIIYRLCTQPNTAYNGSNAGVLNNCAFKSSATAGSNLGNSVGYDAFEFSGPSKLYYKVVARTKGAKDATSITETIIAMQKSVP